MKYAADTRVKLVKLVDRFGRVDVPQHAVIENEVISVAECGTVTRVVIGKIRVVETSYESARAYVVDLMNKR